MKVTIYFKNVGGATNDTFDLDVEEFRHLAADFEKFLKEGKPVSGEYKCLDIDTISGFKKYKKLVLDFEKISAIG